MDESSKGIREWVIATTLFLLSLPVVALLLFFSFPLMGDMWSYDMAQSVVPMICPRDVPFSSCYEVSGWPANWSYLIWASVAIAFGGLLRERRARTKILAGAVVIGVTIALMQLVIHTFGWRQYIDAL